MQRPKPGGASITERLRRVLEAAYDSRKDERLEQIRQSRNVLEPAEFRRLFETDTTWGDFGERSAHYDKQLHVLAAMRFRPLERDTLHNADDITLLGTPIYRILLTLAAIMMKENDFEGCGSRNLLLPHRPATGTEVGRYVSLLDVACSLLFEICDAYVQEQSPKLVQELYCVNVNRTRANYVWLDYSTESGQATVRYTSITTLTTPPCLVLSPLEEIDEEEAPGVPSLCLKVCGAHPWIHFVSASSRLSAYVLLTRDAGTYVSFHRVVEGRLARYPLYFHLLDPDTSPKLSGDVCVVCGRRGTNLMENSLDIEQGLLYCNRACIAQMDHIRYTQSRHEAEARAQLAKQQGLPPGRHDRTK